MRMTSRLVEREAGSTEVAISSQVNVMGILAQFGRGMIQDVSDQMFDKFVAAVRAELETPAVTPSSSSPAGQPRPDHACAEVSCARRAHRYRAHRGVVVRLRCRGPRGGPCGAAADRLGRSCCQSWLTGG